MRFTEFKGEIPMRGCARHNLKAELTEFMNMNVKVAKVTITDHDYKNAKSAYENLHKAAKKYGFPIDVTKRKDDIYIIRKDI